MKRITKSSSHIFPGPDIARTQLIIRYDTPQQPRGWNVQSHNGFINYLTHFEKVGLCWAVLTVELETWGIFALITLFLTLRQEDSRSVGYGASVSAHGAWLSVTFTGGIINADGEVTDTQVGEGVWPTRIICCLLWSPQSFASTCLQR